MRLLSPPFWLLVVLCGCTAGDDGPRVEPTLPAPALLADFHLRSRPALCGEIEGPGWLRTLTPIAGGGHLALAMDGASVAVLDDSLRAATSVRLPRLGEGAIRDPVDAWLLRDTLVVADAAGRSLHRMPWGDPAGSFRRIPLPFTPHALVPLGGELGVVPLGGHVGSMLLRSGGDDFLPLPLPLPALGDPRLRILAGALETTLVEEGVAVLGHPLLVPLLYLVEAGTVNPIATPIPDGQGDAVGWVPTPPFDEEDIVGMLAPSLDLAPGVEGSSLLVLTRSGGWTGGFREKAVLELRLPGMELIGALRLPVNAVLLAKGGLDALPVMDGDGVWYRCGAVPPVAHAGSVPSRHGADGNGGPR